MTDDATPTPPERPESEPLPDERRGSELFGVPAMVLLLAVVAMVKGAFEDNLGFVLVGAVVVLGTLLAVGYSMTIAKRV